MCRYLTLLVKVNIPILYESYILLVMSEVQQQNAKQTRGNRIQVDFVEYYYSTSIRVYLSGARSVLEMQKKKSTISVFRTFRPREYFQTIFYYI